jgi:hypothetical protein
MFSISTSHVCRKVLLKINVHSLWGHCNFVWMFLRQRLAVSCGLISSHALRPSSLNRMWNMVCSRVFSTSKNYSQLAMRLYKVSCSLETMPIQTIVVKNHLYLCRYGTNPNGNSAFTCTCASLHGLQNIPNLTYRVLIFWFRSGEGTVPVRIVSTLWNVFQSAWRGHDSNLSVAGVPTFHCRNSIKWIRSKLQLVTLTLSEIMSTARLSLISVELTHRFSGYNVLRMTSRTCSRNLLNSSRNILYKIVLEFH